MYPYNIKSQYQTELSEDSNYQAMNTTNDFVDKSNTHPPHIPQNTPPYPIKPDERLLKMIDEGILEEQRMADYYSRLMRKLRNPEDKELVRHMRMDSLKHVKILNEIYYNVSGRRSLILSANVEKQDQELMSDYIINSLDKDILGLLDSTEYYRKLYVSFLNVEIRDMLQEVISDKQTHGIKLTLLYSKNK